MFNLSVVKNFLTFIKADRKRKAALIFLSFIMLFLLWPVGSERLNSGDSLRVFSGEGYLLREFSSSDSGGYQVRMKISELPSAIIDSVIKAEDRRFYYHPGFDLLAIARSFRQNLKSGRIISGGSTITQQMVRILYGDTLPGNPWLRKLVEIPLAVRLEIHFSKNEILEAYLNRVPMKYNQYGLPAAARRIFGRDIRFLSAIEGTALAVLIRENNASRENFRMRLRMALDDSGLYGEEEILSVEESVFRKGIYRHRDESSGTLHFEEFIKSLGSDSSGDIHTVLSGNLNSEIRKIIRNEQRFINRYMAENCSVVVLRLPEKGGGRTELAAMVGSEDFHGESGQVNGAIKVRQAGSSLKPFVYGYAMDHLDYMPYSIVNDLPLTLGINDNETFSPKNNDLKFWGPVTVREALACSRNIPAVEMVQKIGVINFYRFLGRCGFSNMEREPAYYGPGLALGTGGASLLQLCRGYSAIACSGRMYPLFIGRGRGGNIIMGDERKIFSEKTAYRLVHILSDSEARRRAFGRRNFLDFPFDVAAKTGTSKDYRDAWTVGFTDRYVIGVWVGNFSGKEMNSISGGWGAGRIFHQIVRLVTDRERPGFKPPPGFRMVRFCRTTGLMAGKGCSICMEPVSDDEKLPVVCTGCVSGGERSAFSNASGIPEILSPVNGESFVIDPLVPVKNQYIPVRLAGVEGNGTGFSYSIDGRERLPLRKNIRKMIMPVRGEHVIEIYSDGECVERVTFSVE